MSTRNKLLESIVLALGGTVTNPNNRNQLLYDWLIAKGGVPPQTRYAYSFNSIDSYIDSGEITLSGDFSVECDIQTTQAVDFAICDGSKFNSLPTYALIYVDNPDGLQFLIKNPASGFDRYIFGGRSEITNGQVNNIKLSRVGSELRAYVNSVQIGSSANIGTDDVTLEGLWFGGSSRYMVGKGYNVKINDGSVYNFPINDRTFGVGAVIKNTGTGSDAVGVNLLESGWTEIPL